MDIQMVYFNSFHRREKHGQQLAYRWVMLHVSGLQWVRISTQKNKTIYEAKKPGPFVFVGLPGMYSESEYGSNRENWVAMFTGEAIQPGRSKDNFLLQSDEGQVLIPVIQALPHEDVPLWQDAMRRLQEVFVSPTPRNRLLTQLRTFDLLRRVLELRTKSVTGSGARRLKQLIDADTNFADSLAELSERCRYSSDHLRLLFKQVYGVVPQEYRSRRRMALARELIASSDLTVKEIAAQLGFSQVSHFSAAFKTAFGHTASEAIRRSR